MPGRRFWAVLLLAAVFAMHGLQCAAGMLPAGGAHHTAPALAVAAVGPVGHVTAGAPTPDGPEHLGTTEAARDTPSPAPSGHLEALCLAVAAAGLAVLLLALGLPSRGVPLSPRWHRAMRRPGWLRPPRPPDLHALCLLRT
ncbi:DUF6153 family protein [Blastococcus tunisiensis]|uniref:MYXO-CTERM domain-containing protein n=1 Tax=Blastococcus tunisiensis TaxID=1798228 RepID=A0A1I2H0S1_9ACTN|nr:DUF6153 family protein [Blastococcus sp. DSM 46838]SFF22331.1 hypothetical protein SAMN05216574_11047 [Blastococcus sp. DSM 46838]